LTTIKLLIFNMVIDLMKISRTSVVNYDDEGLKMPERRTSIANGDLKKLGITSVVNYVDEGLKKKSKIFFRNQE